jgi:hypothetical protein
MIAAIAAGGRQGLPSLAFSRSIVFAILGLPYGTS